MQNSKNIHFFFHSELDLFCNAVDFSAFKRRFSGEHVAINISNLEAKTECFDNIININLNLFQKICFSPVMGEEVALNILADKLSECLNSTYENGFNLFGHKTSGTISNLFKIKNKIGHTALGDIETCNDNVLKLLHLYRKIEGSEIIISRALIKKSLKQFDAEALITHLASTISHKLHPHNNSLKKIIVLNCTNAKSETDESIIYEISKFFTLINDTDEEKNCLIPDAKLGDRESGDIDISTLDKDEALGNISTSISSSINSWFVRTIFFNYLGLSKCSYSIEKMLSTYPKEMLQDYLFSQISQLKDMVGILVTSERQNNPEASFSAIKTFAKLNSPLGITLIIHLAQGSDQADSARNDNLKNRLRSLNTLYERIFRLCSIDIPKSDLSLTL